MTERIPPNQNIAPKMVPMPPIGGKYPHIEKNEWHFRVYDEVAQEIIWDWDEFLKLPQERLIVDFHCVTHWSKLDQWFDGVNLAEIFKLAKPKDSAKFLIFECYDGYTTNVPMAELKNNLAFIALKMDGKEIEDRFGGPARVVIPHLYAWKSAKFVKAIRFQEQDEPGFWETKGYHNHGDPWLEERYS